MFTSQLAFRQDFAKTLVSPALQHWFDSVRRGQPALAEFPDPMVLRQFLHSPSSREHRRPEVWRALLRGVQAKRTPEAITFLLGLLHPALGAFVDRALIAGALFADSANDHLEAEDAWQQAVACALRALANARVPERDIVLAGLVIEIRQPFRVWLRREFEKAENEAPLLDSHYEANFDGVDDLAAEASVLASWCRAARISKQDAQVIFTTRVAGFPLSRLAPAQSRRYYRLRKGRGRAESRLKAWLARQSEGNHGTQKKSMSQNAPKNPPYKG